MEELDLLSSYFYLSHISLIMDSHTIFAELKKVLNSMGFREVISDLRA